ncbi:MAG: YkgJ family cysteine cluster protein [Rhodocyclaceae bacterium]|nr:YkgJ family cysteine cluster protein [Rhodocyclaceae bacterium]
MSTNSPRRSPAQQLARTADAYQRTTVIPHCGVCASPCCHLDTLVLELDWAEVKSLWQLHESRAAFDTRLAAGQGPEEIRAGNGLYYAHSKPCPAYDEPGHCCRVYGQDTKPPGCSDFPVYEDGGYIVADLRCEAVDLKALTERIAQAVGPAYRIVQSADRDFPFLVTLSVKSQGKK